jgi:hypothetical protein
MRMTLTIVAVLAAYVLTGCSSARTGGIRSANRHVAMMEKITEQRLMGELGDFEGVALLSIGKAGLVGFGVLGWKGTVFVKDPGTGRFGPPSFIGAAGPSVGLAYAGINWVDCLLLFRSREDAVALAKRVAALNFTNEASFLLWGRKSMTVRGGRCFSDGGGVSLGAIELELLVGGPNTGLHHRLYADGTTVEQIHAGGVTVPPELADAIARVNAVMGAGPGN